MPTPSLTSPSIISPRSRGALTLAAALAAFMTLAATPSAEAANCKRNLLVHNSSSKLVVFKPASKTRVNTRWNTHRSIILRPGKGYSSLLTFPIVGCNVKRQVRVEYDCQESPPRGTLPGVYTRKVYNHRNGHYHRPEDIRFAANC